MSVQKEILKRLTSLDERLKSIEGILTKTVLWKAKRYDDVKGLPKTLAMSLKQVKPFFDQNGNMALEVSYEIGSCLVAKDVNGETVVDPRIAAINELNLIPLEDMRKIGEYIEKYLEK